MFCSTDGDRKGLIAIRTPSGESSRHMPLNMVHRHGLTESAVYAGQKTVCTVLLTIFDDHNKIS